MKLENFRSFTQYEIEFPNKPILVIYDQNGEGKTSILEGVLWGIYGDIARYQGGVYNSIDALHNIRSARRSRTEVMLEFELEKTL